MKNWTRLQLDATNFLRKFCFGRELNRKLHRDVFLKNSPYRRIGITKCYSRLKILFYSCSSFYRNRRCASTKRSSNSSNSCSRATRRKCAPISLRVQGIFPRDTFTTLRRFLLFFLPPFLFFTRASSFSPWFHLYADRSSLSYHSQLHLEREPRILHGIFHSREIVFARDSRRCIYDGCVLFGRTSQDQL